MKLKMSKKWLLAVLLTSFIPASAQGQGTIIYSDVWTQQFGDTVTVWATGVTDDLFHGVQHEAIVRTTLQGPNGTPVSEGVGSGYHSTLVNLPAVEGLYSVNSDHRTGCGGFVGSSRAEIEIGVSQTTYQLLSQTPTICNYTKLPSCPSNSCGSAALSGPKNPQNVCDTYKIYNYLFARKSGIKYCFPIGIGFGSTIPGGCN